MSQAKDIMNPDLVTVDPDDTVEEVMARMLEHGISGLPVIDMSGQLVGVITEFDLLELVWDPTTSRNKVYHYMTREVCTVEEDAEIEEVAELSSILLIRRLLVMRGDLVVGIISRRDLLQHVLQIRGQLSQSS